jgi:hypothetical protein
MKYKAIQFVICLWSLLLLNPSFCSAQKEKQTFSFNEFSVDVYHGHLKIPKVFLKDKDGLWQDVASKSMQTPQVNFAGEFFIAVHSCGTCCRYYTLHNLKTGEEIKQVSMFNAGDPTPVTKDGHTYVPILYFKPDSRLLVVQFELDLCTPVERNQCRQRYYVFEDGRFRPISNTIFSCTHLGDEP